MSTLLTHKPVDELSAGAWVRICPKAKKEDYKDTLDTDAAKYALQLKDDASHIGLRASLKEEFEQDFLNDVWTQDLTNLCDMKAKQAMKLGAELVAAIAEALVLPTPAAVAGAAPAAPSETDKALLKSLKAFLCAELNQCVAGVSNLISAQEHIIGYYMGFAAGWVGRNHGDRTQAQVDRDVCEAKGGMAGTQATLAGRAQGAAADMSVGHGAAAANVRTRCIKLYAIVATQSLS